MVCKTEISIQTMPSEFNIVSHVNEMYNGADANGTE